MKRAALGLLLAALVAPLGAAGIGPAGDEYREQRIKTAFLVNFARFATWPAHTFASTDTPIELCILADDAFGAVLADIAKDKLVNDRPLRISRVFRAEDMRRCHIAYVGDAETAGADLAALAGHHVLTVYEGDAPQANGVIRFYLDQDRIRFEVNIADARREGLQLSSKLLGLARIVEQ